MSRVIPLVVALVAVPLAGCGPKARTDPTGTRPTVPAVPPIEIKLPPPDGPKPPAPPSDKEVAQANLKQIGRAFHDFEDAVGHAPAGVAAKVGVGLSWRVQLLPYLRQKALYEQFKLDEPWDSEHNKRLIAKMPEVFASPGKQAEDGKTHLRTFVGRAAFIHGPPPGMKVPHGLPPGQFIKGTKIVSITDGTHNTLIVAEAADPVVWSKPDELVYDGGPPSDFPGQPKPPLPKLGGVFAGGFHGLMADGQVFWFPDKVPEDTIRAAITVSGGEVFDWNPIKFPNGVPAPKEPPTTVPDTLPDAAARRIAVERLQTVHTAAMKFHDAHGHLLAGVVLTKESVGLSWRVQLLPPLGQEALYKEFKLDEPWDSEHNKKLIAKMPEVYSGQTVPMAGYGHTFLRTTRGPQGVVFAPALQPGQKPPPFTREPGQPVTGRKLAEFVDGTSLTILFAESDTAVPWTKPDEIDLLPAPKAEQKTPGIVRMAVPKLGGEYTRGFHAVLADGTIVFYKSSLPTADLSSLLTVAGGEVVEPKPVDHVLYAVPPKAKK